MKEARRPVSFPAINFSTSAEKSSRFYFPPSNIVGMAMAILAIKLGINANT